MRRRDFITLVGSAAVWPAAAIAQQNNKKQLVGFITGFNDKEMMPIFAAFRARMQELGWIEGQNIVFDVRTTSGDYEKLDTEAGSLVSASADLIVAQGTPGLAAARKYTKTIPIVFTQVSDPVGQRLIDSLAHPGGNITGLANFEFASGGKWIELLPELDSKISHVTLITNPANENTAQYVKAITAAGDTKKVAVRVASVRDAADIQDAIENCSKKSGGGLIVFPDDLLLNHRELIVELAARYRLPAVYPFRVFPEVGGLLSYGPSFLAIFRRAADYVDKILKGTRPADLPVETPTKFELVINLKTAQALDLTISRELVFGVVLCEDVLGILLVAVVEKLVEPVRHIFGALFFVGVGMLIEPQLLAKNWPALAILTVVAIVGKTVFVSLASMLIGERPDTAVKTGFAMGQVGTFSILFALAAGGDPMGALLYSLAVALKAVTSILCPLLIRASNPAADWIDHHLPLRVQSALSQYSAWLDRTRKLPQTEGIERGKAG